MHVWGIVVAAGSGTRFGEPKHELVLGGSALWRRAVDALESGGTSNVVVVGDVPGGLPGGERRRDSVRAGLAVIPTEVEWVLIHDAARPLARHSLIRRVLDRAATGDVDGVIPTIPLTDTIKVIRGEVVAATVERSSLVAAQTPQAFRLDVLQGAHDEDDDDATDDASLVERAGGIVVQVRGDSSNIKITYPEDLEIAAILETRWRDD